MQTGTELYDALSDLDSLRRHYATAYRAFRDRFCHLDDGHATARVIERIFTARTASPVRDLREPMLGAAS